jgi:L-lysine exporter family protein LysE/ArgO
MTTAFIHGIILAIGLILPLGVQNIFVFTQGAISKRFIYVLPIVVTAALCDTLLITLAVFGVSVTIMSFVWMKSVLVIGGFIFLIYMGFITWRSKIDDKNTTGNMQFRSNGKMISYTLMISLINPHAILDTIGVIGTSSLSYQGYNKIAFLIACIFISWCWFFTLAFVGRLIGLKDKNGRILGYLNKVSAVVMWVAAIYLVSVL